MKTILIYINNTEKHEIIKSLLKGFIKIKLKKMINNDSTSVEGNQEEKHTEDMLQERTEYLEAANIQTVTDPDINFIENILSNDREEVKEIKLCVIMHGKAYIGIYPDNFKLSSNITCMKEINENQLIKIISQDDREGIKFIKLRKI